MKRIPIILLLLIPLSSECMQTEHPILQAIKNKKLALISRLFTHKTFEPKTVALATDTYNNSSLIWAAYTGQDALAKMLLANGADVNHQNNQGQTALWWACTQGFSRTIKILLNHNANTELADVHNNKPLDIALHKSHSYHTQLLLEAGATINEKDLCLSLSKQPLQIALLISSICPPTTNQSYQSYRIALDRRPYQHNFHPHLYRMLYNPKQALAQLPKIRKKIQRVKKKRPPNLEKCSICLDSMNSIQLLNCKHPFHPNCINNWFKMSNKQQCPLCRAEQ